MGLITSAGIGSGIDVEAIIEALVNAEKAPKSLQFDQKEADVFSTLSGIGSLKAALNELKSSLFNLNSLSAFQQRTASSSDSDVATIEATIASTPGSFDLTVTQIATGSTAETGTFTSSTDTVGSGNLTLTAGSESFSISIDSSDSLEDIRDAINGDTDNFGVNANIINGDSGTILTFSSAITGSGNDIAITNDDASLDTISTEANAGGAGGTTVTQNALSSIITLEGQTITSTTNTFDNAIQDTTITLASTATATDTATLSVSLDQGAVQTNINEFVSTFNAFVNVVNELQNPDINLPGLLLGDSTLRTVIGQLRQDAGSTIDDVSSTFNSLATIGVTTSQSGTLTIDNTVLDEVLASNFDDVGNLFAADSGIANILTDRINEYVTSNGILSSREDTLNNQLDRITQGRVDLDFRISKLESTLRKKFGAMDLIVAQLNSTGDFLAQQLANLPGFYSKSKS